MREPSPITTSITTGSLPNFSSWNAQIEEHAYPKPGKPNATSTLKMATFKLDIDTSEIINIQIHEWPSPLFMLLPEYEYLVRCDWTDNGQ